ncbi:RNA-directed DNA polymerase, eukaryota, reverse transcriptase zinc-binding domain protein [Tanacetum coccineum]
MTSISNNKYIAKILANRLVTVLGDIVSDVQSTFVKDRQILDGPFILNELLQWCKSKKIHSFLLKIDFEKAYDFVRWDYLDDALKNFGFGEKWCGWIQECLRSSWGSVLVNGSPTEEFRFSRGLTSNHWLEIVRVDMSRIQSWDAIVGKMEARLSKWKMKTLSIGGRLTLLKAVLGFGVTTSSQKDSLWARVIKAIHGIDGKIGGDANFGYKSIWSTLIQEMESLKKKDIDLFSYMQKKLGNGVDHSFCSDK